MTWFAHVVSKQQFATKCFTWNHFCGLGPDKTTHRERSSCFCSQKEDRPSSFSIYYLLRRVKRSGFTGGDFKYTDELYREDWCQNSLRTGFHLVSMQRRDAFLSVHRLLSFSRHLRSLWHETSAECASDVPFRRMERVRDSQDSRKFYSSNRREQDSPLNNFSGISVLQLIARKFWKHNWDVENTFIFN